MEPTRELQPDEVTFISSQPKRAAQSAGRTRRGLPKILTPADVLRQYEHLRQSGDRRHGEKSHRRADRVSHLRERPTARQQQHQRQYQRPQRQQQQWQQQLPVQQHQQQQHQQQQYIVRQQYIGQQQYMGRQQYMGQHQYMGQLQQCQHVQPEAVEQMQQLQQASYMPFKNQQGTLANPPAVGSNGRWLYGYDQQNVAAGIPHQGWQGNNAVPMATAPPDASYATYANAPVPQMSTGIANAGTVPYLTAPGAQMSMGVGDAGAMSYLPTASTQMPIGLPYANHSDYMLGTAGTGMQMPTEIPDPSVSTFLPGPGQQAPVHNFDTGVPDFLPQSDNGSGGFGQWVQGIWDGNVPMSGFA